MFILIAFHSMSSQLFLFSNRSKEKIVYRANSCSLFWIFKEEIQTQDTLITMKTFKPKTRNLINLKDKRRSQRNRILLNLWELLHFMSWLEKPRPTELLKHFIFQINDLCQVPVKLKVLLYLTVTNSNSGTWRIYPCSYFAVFGNARRVLDTWIFADNQISITRNCHRENLNHTRQQPESRFLVFLSALQAVSYLSKTTIWST